jgi:hypothetical protein
MKIEHSCGMSHVGTHPFTGQLFQLESVDVAQRIGDRVLVGPISASASKQRPATPNNILCQSEPYAPQQLPISLTTTNWRRVDDAASARSQEIIGNIVAQGSQSPVHKAETGSRTSRTSASSPRSSSEQADKIYCSYWIRSGECDYTQQGCRYKHEMPDKQTLASIGFRTVPRWWQEKVAIQLGQSAIPTVGPVMKPAEWLKQRRASQDSQSDEESGSEQDSDADDEKESDVETAPSSVLQHPAAVLCPASDKDEEGTAPKLESVEKGSDVAATDAPVTATTETINEPCQLSLDVDLIDLSPIGPIGTSSCKTHDANTSTQATVARPATIPVLSFSEVASKQVASPPRKVFVLAGESTEFHVADARKHAQTRKVNMGASIESKQYKPKDSKIDMLPTTSPISILKRSDPKPGLKASMHAPHPTREESPRSDKPSDAKPLQRSPVVNSSSPNRKETHNKRTKARVVKSPDHSRAASQTVEPPKSTTRKAKTGHVKSDFPKPAHGSHQQIPKGVCRPRRPAASSSKAVVSRVVTGGTKE